MLLQSPFKSAASVIALFVVAIPLALAELRQGPTGIEYVKRFLPSPGVGGCYLECPATSPGGVPLINGVTGNENTEDETTVCIYSLVSAETYFDCNYRTASGLPIDGSANDGRCPLQAVRSPGCPAFRKRRILSPLEQVVRSRQYDPKRRASRRPDGAKRHTADGR